MRLHYIDLGENTYGSRMVTLKIVECDNTELYFHNSANNEIIYNTTDNVLMHMGNIIPRYAGNLSINGIEIAYTFSGAMFRARIANSLYDKGVIGLYDEGFVIIGPREKEIVETIKEVPVEVIKEVVKDNLQVIKGEFTGSEYNIPNYKPSNGILVLKFANGNNISNYTVTGGGKVKILAQVKDTDTIYYEITKIK